MSRRTAFAAALLIVVAPLLGSAEDEKKALIHELMKVMGAEDLLRRSVEKMIDVSYGEIDLEAMPPEERARYETAMRLEADHRAKVLQRVDLRKYSALLFYPLFERYSVSELKEALAFYKTPAGQKSIALIPELATTGSKALRLMSEDLAAADRDVEQEEKPFTPPWKSTMADIRSVATATEAYATDTNEYPQAVTLDELAEFLSPTYIRTTPRTDGWGHELTYIVSPDRQHYRFVSAGADGRLDFDATRLATLESELKAQQRETTDTDEDIIYQDGAFVRFPHEASINR